MPSVNTGKYKIKSIKVYKDHVTLTFFKHDKAQISKEAYLSSYLYEGKSISQKEITKLLEITALSTLLNYALSLVSKKHYSEKKMYEKLKSKETDKTMLTAVINKLKENDLLDDRALMLDLIAWDDERKFGKNKIIKHLKEQGIPDSLINKAHFSSVKEAKKAKALLPKLERKYDRLAFENKKKHIYQALLSQGYELDVIKMVIDDIKEDKPKIAQEKLLNDYQKIKSRYRKKYDGYELKQKIYAALVNKGYRHQEIKNVLEDITYENDY